MILEKKFWYHRTLHTDGEIRSELTFAGAMVVLLALFAGTIAFFAIGGREWTFHYHNRNGSNDCLKQRSSISCARNLPFRRRLNEKASETAHPATPDE